MLSRKHQRFHSRLSSRSFGILGFSPVAHSFTIFSGPLCACVYVRLRARERGAQLRRHNAHAQFIVGFPSGLVIMHTFVRRPARAKCERTQFASRRPHGNVTRRDAERVCRLRSVFLRACAQKCRVRARLSQTNRARTVCRPVFGQHRNISVWKFVVVGFSLCRA